MKYFLFFLILNFTFCLKAKKSPFDLSEPSFGMIGFIFASLNRTTSSDTTPPTVTVTNLKSKGTIETGSIVGTASDNVGVSSVEVQINSGSYAAATLTTTANIATPSVSWKYSYPKGSSGNILKQGPKNTISIRATSKSGKQTTLTLTEIRKGENKDIDGDGLPDFVLGSPNFPSGANNGRVYIFYSSQTNATQTAKQTLDGTAGSYFGMHTLLSDFNQDGYVDLFVCASIPGTSAANRGYLYNGTANGISSSISLTFVPPLGGSSGEFCKTNPVVGDFNGDGFPDLAIGDVTGPNGQIYIYNGGSSGLSTTPTLTILGSTSNFGGYTLAVGDINGDGFTDLASATATVLSKDIFIFHGSVGGLNTSISNATTSILVGGGLSNRIAFGDLNNDGFDDLAVGDTTLTSNTGRLSIYLSNGSTISTTVSLTINGNGTSQFFPSANGQYARTIAIADINQDGKNDLIVGNGGATTPGTNQGSIFIFNGCSSNSLCIANGSNASSANYSLSGSAASDFFGYSLSISDINNDGIPDLLTSAKGYNSNRGGLYIFLNKGTGFTTSISNVDRLFTGENVNDNSGASL